MAVILVALLAVSICLIFVKLKRRFELGLKIPGPLFVPFVGCVQFATTTPESIFLVVNDLRQKYRRSFRLWLGVSLWVFLHSPEEAKQVLNNVSVGRSSDFRLLMPLVGEGLLVSKGRKWSARRKALTPAFHSTIMESFIDSFCQSADVFVDRLRGNEVVEISNRIFLCILDMICETAMGVKVNCQGEVDSVYAKAFHDCSHLLYERMVNPLLGIDLFYQFTNSGAKLKKAIKTIHQLTENMIIERRIIQIEKLNVNNDPAEGEIGLKRKQALLDVLLTIKIDGKFLSDEDIKEEVNTFLFAGVDTTKASLCFALYNLGKYQQYQDKVLDEIWTVMGKDPAQKIEINHINQLTYLDLFIKESMRFHTTVPLTSREIPEETLIGDVILPKSSSAWVNMYGLAHDPDLFEKPNEFIPERFDVNEKANEIVPFSYLPYAGGPRICIGKRYSLLMMKVLIVKMLLTYKIALAEPDEELVLISEMVLKSKTGIKLKLTERPK